jgi:hypothetical protein
MLAKVRQDGQDGRGRELPRVRRSRSLCRGRFDRNVVPILMEREKVMKKQRRGKNKRIGRRESL